MDGVFTQGDWALSEHCFVRLYLAWLAALSGVDLFFLPGHFKGIVLAWHFWGGVIDRIWMGFRA